jgi:hypothetical protein
MTKTTKYLILGAFIILCLGWVLKCCIQHLRRDFRPEKITLNHAPEKTYTDTIKTDTGKIQL